MVSMSNEMTVRAVIRLFCEVLHVNVNINVRGCLYLVRAYSGCSNSVETCRDIDDKSIIRVTVIVT